MARGGAGGRRRFLLLVRHGARGGGGPSSGEPGGWARASAGANNAAVARTISFVVPRTLIRGSPVKPPGKIETLCLLRGWFFFFDLPWGFLSGRTGL